MKKLLVRIDKIKVLDDYRLQVAMSDGRIGVFNALPYLNKGFFVELKNREYFAQVKLIHNGTGIAWERGQDLSADTIDCNLQLLSNENAKQGNLPRSIELL